MDINLTTVIELLSSLGTLGLLALLLWLFFRGDLLSRKVYEELTKNIMSTLVQQIMDEVRGILEDWRREYLQTK